jgi:hypothetical protein
MKYMIRSPDYPVSTWSLKHKDELFNAHELR